MTAESLWARLQEMTAGVVAQATGREHREDAVLSGTGGPAGNARLTAWTGLLLLALIVAELVTLLDVRGLITWHLVIGVLLVPPALLKTASTGWRILRYYRGARPYREAGPPPVILRVLGPFVVLSTVAVLASGLALIVVGPDASRRSLLQAFGQRVDAITIHQATFIVWAGVTGLHTLTRIVPALLLTVVPRSKGPRVPGLFWRGGVLAATVILAAGSAALVLGASESWRSQPFHHDDGRPPGQHGTFP
jgi:hypothetical protein